MIRNTPFQNRRSHSTRLLRSVHASFQHHLATTALVSTMLLSAAPLASALSKSETFDTPASASTNGWKELGSRDNGQNFGFSETSLTGGPAGEAGGIVKRDVLRAEYVDVFTNKLTLNDFISASGRIIVPGTYEGNLGHVVGHSDSRLAGSESQANQLGIVVASSGTRLNVHLSLANAVRQEAVVVVNGLSTNTVYDWDYSYDPTAGTTGNGALTVHIVTGGVTNTGVYNLTATDRAIGAEFDCFGLTSRALPSAAQTGTAFIDEVTYTVQVPSDYVGIPLITVQPQSVSVPAGTNVDFTVNAFGGGLAYQWRVNGVNIPGATTNTYSLVDVVPDLPASYSVAVSNSFGVTVSTEVTVTVINPDLFDTAVMTNIWELLPGDRFYLTASGNTARGLAYYPASTNVILVSRSGGNAVVSLDAATGAEQFFLDTGIVSGGTLAMGVIGVSDDGAVYVANLTTSATNLPYVIYRWATNDAFASPTIAFSGDPGGTNFPALRWGDNMAVRGGGTNTEILISPGNVGGSAANIVALLRTADGIDFQNGIPPTLIEITNAQSGFANLGITFGPGSNTFFAKAPNFPLTFVEFDATSRIGFIKQSYSSSVVPGSVSTIAVDLSRNFLAGLAIETPDNTRLYDLADLTRDPVLVDQEAFSADNSNTTTGGTGAATFGGNRLFVLDSNNGIKAFELNSSYSPPAPFNVNLQVQAGPSVLLSWPTETGRLYQVTAKNSLGDPEWGKIGLPVPGTGGPITLTNRPVFGIGSRLYRVQGQ